MLNAKRLDELLSAFGDLRIALVGDLFLDRYLYVEYGVEELSIETGLEAYQITSVRNSPGALGTIINNLAAMGVRDLRPCSVIGNDGHATDLMTALGDSVDASRIIFFADRMTPTYTKPMRRGRDDCWVELNRFDFRDRRPIDEPVISILLDEIEQVVKQVDGVIILDQIAERNWGVVTDKVRDRLRQLQADNPDVLFYSDSRRHLKHFGFGVLKCNENELLASSTSAAEVERGAIESALCAMSSRTGQAAYCTLGSDGILSASPAGECIHATGIPVDGETDIVGAGDSASSAIVCALLAGASAHEAAQVANLAASITVKKIGETGVASADEIREQRLRIGE